MTDFRRALLIAGSACALIASAMLMMAVPFAHLSCTGDFARQLSIYSLGFGGVLLLLGGWGLWNWLEKESKFPLGYGPGSNRCAKASIVVGFPLFGLMTWGIASLAGIVLGVLGLHRACTVKGAGGKDNAMTGICISFATLPLILVMILFLGP